MNSEKNQNEDKLLTSLITRYPELEECIPQILDAKTILFDTFRSGNKVLVCGNGGSASDAEHIVGELMKSFRRERLVDSLFCESYEAINGKEVPWWLEGALPAISLSSHSALFTAFCNDKTSVGVFAQQVYGLGVENDTLIALSTSGGSENVIEAARVAKAKKINVLSLTGRSLSELFHLSDVCIRVPCEETYLVQELHLPIYHYLCASIEERFFIGGSCG